MSDFGTLVCVFRASRESTTADDEALVKCAARELVTGERDRLSDYADFDLRFGGSRAADGSEGVMVSLTEYCHGDEDDNEGLDAEVLIARDGRLAEQFAEEMRAKLGAEYTVEVYCGHW